MSRLNSTVTFHLDARGVASIEFAMVVPVMLMIFIGIVEFSQATTVNRRVNQVASSTADLVARTKQTTTSEMSGVMDMIDELLKPYDHTLLKITVANVVASPSDATNTTVCWSYNHNGGASNYSNGSTYALPSDLVKAGESVVVAEVTYAYQPLIFDFFIKKALDFTATQFLKPRLSSSIEFDSVKC